MHKDEALAAFFGKLPSDNGKASAAQMLALLRGWTDSDFANAATGEYCEDIKAMLEGAFSRVLDRLEALQAQPVGEEKSVCEHCGGNGYTGGVMPPEDMRGEYDVCCEVCLGSGIERAALTASPPVVEREARTEYGWLIERDDPQGLLYRMASRFDRDHMKALRFARREDAQAFCDAFLTDHRHTVAHPQYTRIAEHAWD